MLQRLTAGTAVSDAILAGQRSADCEKKFFECNMKSKNIQQMLELLMRSINYWTDSFNHRYSNEFETIRLIIIIFVIIYEKKL